MAIRGKVGSADPRDRPTWPHHVSHCAFSQWLTCGPLWLFQVYGSVGGGLLRLWALETLCWTRGGVWFVGRGFSWIVEVSWPCGRLCASTSPRGLVWVPLGLWYCVILSCTYLFHPSSEVYKWYIRFDRLDEPVTLVQSKIGIWDYLWWCHIYAINALALSYIISCVFWLVLHQKLETPTLVEIFCIKPYPSVDDHFRFILCRSWRCKSST
jgi:hypothetical protein